MSREDIDLDVIDDRPLLFRKMCHGDPKRCLWIGGRPAPLCSRCMAFYLALISGALFSAAFLTFDLPASRAVLLLFTITISPMAIDGGTQYLGWRRSNNTLRTITGLIAGGGAGFTSIYCLLWILLRTSQ